MLNKANIYIRIDLIDFIYCVLAPLSAIFQLHHGDQFQWWKKPEYPVKTTDHGQATGKLYHLRCESSSPFCVIYKAGREPTRIGD
jgi:hypothetical protein